MGGRSFKILTLGYGYELLKKVWDGVAQKTDYQISHVLHPSIFPLRRKKLYGGHTVHRKLFFLFERPLSQLPIADLAQLAELEGDGGPTINNLILGDDRLRRLPYDEATRYISVVVKRLVEVLRDANPDVVLSGYEGFHSTLFMLICRKFGVPWYALTYMPFPRGMCGFSTTCNSKGVRSFGASSDQIFRRLAETTMSDFETNKLSAFVPKTENSILNLLNFLPLRLKNGVASLERHLTGNFDKYTHRPFDEAVRDYVRRRKNLLSNRSLSLLCKPPDERYVFFGLHMQPEMGIDVWAPFYSNQMQVIEYIARSIPPTHRVVVKLHPIDADNWSNRDLIRLRETLGVRLVSAHASTRDFIRSADLVFSIQGTTTLEAALMGRKVITFGETMYEDISSVTRVDNLTTLPTLVRDKLKRGNTTREEILSGLVVLLKRFRPGLYNNWALPPSEVQLVDFCNHLNELRLELRSRNDGVLPNHGN